MGPLDPHGPRCGAPAAPPSRGAWECQKIIIKPDLWNPTFICTTSNKDNYSITLKKKKEHIQ